MASSSPRDAFSDDDFAALSELLDARSTLDTDGLLGVLYAVAVAPGMLAPSTWLKVVLPNGLGDVDAASAQEHVGLVFRLFNAVLDSVNGAELSLIPEEEDTDGCGSFAAGFAAGAEIDPLWIGDDDRWTFASWAAYLGDRLDLVPKHTLAKLDAMVDARQNIRRDMPAIIKAAHESFTKLRRAALAGQPGQSPPRVGRNEPCPCGSGKKFKRCCIDQRAAIGSS